MTLEEAIVLVFNTEGWELTIRNGIAHGKTPKGKDCLMILRKKQELEIKKNELVLLRSSAKEVQLYFVITKRVGYLFWMNDLILTSDNDRYLLEKSQAAMTYAND